MTVLGFCGGGHCGSGHGATLRAAAVFDDMAGIAAALAGGAGTVGG